MRLSSVFLLVKHLEECREFADEIIFYQRVRKQIGKASPGNRKVRQLEEAVRDLVDDSVEATGVVDIFKVAGLEKADISILDDHFLQTFKDRPYENLRLKLLEQLLQDELRQREKNNLAKYRSFREILEATLQRYHNRLIDAAAVIQVMLKIREEELREQERASELNLAPEELAFYDAVADNLAQIYDQQFLTSLIHDVVQAVKRNLKVDWTEPHRDAVRAEVRAAVRRVLRTRQVRREHFDFLIERIMEQAAPTSESATLVIEAKNGANMGKKIAIGCVGVVLVFLLIVGVSVGGAYNSLVQLDQATQAQWAQVQNAYQRRADLVPNLVATVKGAANFEQSTMTAVTEARAKVGQVTPAAMADITKDPAAFQRYQQAQQGLSSALSHLLMVTENYPQLKATANFRDLQAQLEGTENRITVERQRFNEAAQAFNTRRSSFPTVIIAGFFGDKFATKPYFQAQSGSETAPEVKF